MSKIRDSKTYGINDFLNWNENGELEISPKFQRNKVWNQNAKSYLIDTILRGMPIPPIFLTQKIDLSTRKTLREVIDGQQRLTAITEFKNNEFKIQKTHNQEIGGKYYDELSDEYKISFLEYEIPVEIIKTESNAIIYDIFARLNTNTVPLNKQELRNSKYWGEFKTIVNKMALKYNSFFSDIGTFTDKQFLRMVDSEFIASVMILMINGISTDTSKSIDEFYKKYDKDFTDSDVLIEKLDSTISYIEELYTQGLQTKFFNKKNQLYTLIAAVNYINSGLVNLDVDIGNINLEDNLKFKMFLSELESKIDRIEDETIPEDEYIELLKFLSLHKTRTTSKEERIERVTWLINALNNYYGE